MPTWINLSRCSVTVKMRVTYDCHDMEAYVKKLFVMNVQRYDAEVDIFGSYKLQRSNGGLLPLAARKQILKHLLQFAKHHAPCHPATLLKHDFLVIDDTADIEHVSHAG